MTWKHLTTALAFLASTFIITANIGCNRSEKPEKAKKKERVIEAWVKNHGQMAISAPHLSGSLAVDRSGHVYVTVPKENNFAVLMKYDSAGNLLWSSPYIGAPSKMAVDTSGNVYVIGTDPRAVVYKYDKAGKKVWFAVSKDWPGGMHRPQAVKVDGLGNVYVAGLYFGHGCFYVTIKYDVNGKKLWTSRYRTPSEEKLPVVLDVDNSGNVYVAGTFSVIKYDFHGKQLWVAEAIGNDIVLDKFGDVYVSGYQAESSDYETAKYDTAGNQEWIAQHRTTSSTARPVSIELDSSGNVYVARMEAILKYDKKGHRLWTFDKGGLGIALDGKDKIYVRSDFARWLIRKFDSHGNEKWVARYEPSKRDPYYPIEMAVDDSGNAYILFICRREYFTAKFIVHKE